MSSLRSGKGFVLFIVLLIVWALSAFLFSLYYLSQSKYKEAEGIRDYVVAYHGAVSAVKIALKLLREDRNSYDGEGDDWYSPFTYNYNGIFISVKIRDECGKLNVNEITDPRLYGVLKRLLDEISLDEEVAEAIRKRVKEKPLRSVGELYTVKGINFKTAKKLSRYLTVYGGSKLNVNSAAKELLKALSLNLSEEGIESLLKARPIKELSELLDLPGITKETYFEIRPLLTNRCNYFKIEATASYNGQISQVEAYTSRYKVLEWKVVK